MKFIFSAHQFLWTDCWTDGSLPILESARELGLDGMEVSLGDDVLFDAAALKKGAEDLRMELTVGPGNVWPMECDVSSDDAEQRRLGIAWHRRMIGRCVEIGAVAYCGAIYGHPGRVLRRRRPPDEFLRVSEKLRELAEFAAQCGVKLVIEPMSRFRTHVVNTTEQAMNLIGAAEHPNLFINFDTYHMMTEERNYAAAIRRAAPRFFGVHACENDRGVPGGGLVPWKDVFAALRETQSVSRVMLETYNTSGDFGFSRGVFQNVCPDPAAFVRTGLHFLRSHAA